MNLSTNPTYDVVQIHDEGSLVAEMYGGSFEERVERGRVMAASPSLLKAAEELIQTVELYQLNELRQRPYREMKRAVQKARGEGESI